MVRFFSPFLVCCYFYYYICRKMKEKINHILSFNKWMEKHISQIGLKSDLIYEMAYSRIDFKRKVDDLIIQITQNWCLINYSKNLGMNPNITNHWKTELGAHISNIAKMKLKNNNSFDARMKVLNEVLIDESEMGKDPEVINMSIFFKFKNEGLSTDDEIYGKTIINFINEVPVLINLLAKGDLNSINNYIDKM